MAAWYQTLGIVTLIGSAMLASAGCSRTPPAANAETANLKALGILYGKYVAAHNGRMPPSEKELLGYLSSGESSMLQQFGIHDPSTLLKSPRGDKHLTVVVGKGTITDPNAFVAYESEAVEGSRWVAWTTGQVQELDEASFQAQKPHM